jgi:hypothetical protein
LYVGANTGNFNNCEVYPNADECIYGTIPVTVVRKKKNNFGTLNKVAVTCTQFFG